MRPNLQPLQPKRFTVATVLAVALATCVGVASIPRTAPATPLGDKQAAARELDRQVRALEQQYDELQERYRGAQIELDSVTNDVQRARIAVEGTRRNLGRARVRLRNRAISLYQAGGTGNQLVDLAVAGSFSDFFDRMDAARRVGSQDANVLGEVRALNQRMELKQRRLKAALARQAKVVARAKRDKSRMGAVLAKRQAKLDSVNADIRQIMEAQRAAAERAAAARARETAGQADTTGAASPGTSAAGSGGSGSGSSSGGSGISIPLPPGSSTAAAAANFAMSKLGSPYVWAASGPNAFDCSGLVIWAFAQAGRPGLPHSTYSLVNMGVSVPMDQLQVGDLVFSAGNGHMGIYVGNNSFVHAPHSGDVVKVTSFSSYQLSHARRI